MKRVKSKFHFLAISVLTAAVLGLGACSKSDSGTTPPPGPTPIGGYVSSDSVAASSLIAYFPFDGNSNDVKGSQTATASGVTYAAGGVRGQAYQGATGAYATLPAGHAYDSLKSYSLSVWYNLAAQPADGNPGGMFFLAGTNELNLLLLETEHYAPVSGDSVRVHHGFNDVGGTGPYKNFTMEAFDTAAIGKWVHFVMTYDGPSSTYVVYQNGVAVLNQSAFGKTTSTVLQNNNPGGSPLGNMSFATDGPATVFIGTWPPTLYGVSPTLGANGSYLGEMDELRVFNKALTTGEVAGLYLNGKANR
jgi:hypothetical protein